jgi:hypothetical protein
MLMPVSLSADMYRKVDEEEPYDLDLDNEPEYLDDEDEDSWDVPDD